MSEMQPQSDQLICTRSPLRHMLRYALLAMILFVGWAILMGPSSVDIRVDTGDLRYRILGVPIYYERMPEPQRTKLLELTRRSPALKSEWCRVAPQRTSNNPELMCQSFYYRAAAWVDEDPAMAAIIAEDVAQYIRRTHAREGLPETFPLLMCAQRERDNGPVKVRPDWRNDPHVREYFAQGTQTP